MNYLLYFFIFYFGAILGSFLNVVSIRYGKEDFVSKRSKCLHCGRRLGVNNLFPIFSFIFQKGRCSYCNSIISFRYPLVEIVVGLLFLISFIQFSNFSLLYIIFLWAVFSVMTVISLYDFDNKLIPDIFSVILFAFSFFSIFFDFSESIFYTPNILDLTSGFIVALPLFLLWLVSGGRWIGLADSKLVLPFGFILGIAGGLSAVVIGFWVGAVWSLLLIFISKYNLSAKLKGITIKSEVPFAPFLIVGFLITLFFNINLFY